MASQGWSRELQRWIVLWLMLIANCGSSLLSRRSDVSDAVTGTISVLVLIASVAGSLFFVFRLPVRPDGQLRPSEWWVLGPVMCLGFTLIAFNIAQNHNHNLRNDVFAAAALAMIICAVMLLGLGRKLFRRRNQR
jgi:Kef-type K+ transport system membrane component KefB